MSALIEFRQVCKTYQMGDTTVRAADHISMRIEKGEFVAIVGQSGSGKSTCMNIIGCLDVPTSGTYLLDGRDVGQMDTNQLAAIRNELLGFIFQQYNLIQSLTVLENVELPLIYQGVNADDRRDMALEAHPEKKIHIFDSESASAGERSGKTSQAHASTGTPAMHQALWPKSMPSRKERHSVLRARVAAAGLAGSMPRRIVGSCPSRNRNAAPASASELSCSTCQEGVCSKNSSGQCS